MSKPFIHRPSNLWIIAGALLVPGCAFFDKITGKEAERAKMEADYDPGTSTEETGAFSANAEDYEELSLLDTRLQALEGETLPSVAELDGAVAKLQEAAEAQGVVQAKLDRALTRTMAKGKVNTGGIPRRSRKSLSEALEGVLSAAAGFAELPAAIDSSRQQIEELRIEMMDRSDRVIDRCQKLEESPSRETRLRADRELTRTRRLQRELRKRFKTLDAKVDTTAERGPELAKVLGLTWAGTERERAAAEEAARLAEAEQAERAEQAKKAEKAKTVENTEPDKTKAAAAKGKQGASPSKPKSKSGGKSSTATVDEGAGKPQTTAKTDD